MKITKELHPSQVEAHKPGDPPLCDGRGLYLLTTGTKRPRRHWQFRHRSPVTGKRTGVVLGTYPELTLSEARRKRDALAAQVAKGCDLADERRRARDGRVTLSAAAEAWDAGREGSVVSSTRTAAMARFRTYVAPSLGERPIASITPSALTEALDPLKDAKPETAHRTFTVLGQIFRFAERREWLERNPTYALRGEYPSREAGHFAAIVEPVAFGGMLRAIDGYTGHFQTRAALQLLALVFVRPGKELLGARWPEFDLEAARWTIPAARMKRKQNGDHVVPLSTQAVALLRDLHAFGARRGDRVFPGLRPGKNIVGDTLNAALRTLNYGELHTAHGFRSSASTMLNQLAVSPEWLGKFDAECIEFQLHHRPYDTQRANYMRAKLLGPRAVMMQVWADECDRLRAAKQGQG